MSSEDTSGREITFEIEAHDEKLENHDRRISRNENWRLQMMGALKFAGFVIGTAITMLGVFVAAGLI